MNIRQYFRPSNSTEERPSRSGIALRLDEWTNLLIAIANLHKRMPELANRNQELASKWSIQNGIIEQNNNIAERQRTSGTRWIQISNGSGLGWQNYII